MNPLRPGPVMALRHFSLSRPLTCSLISGNLENFFTLRINGPVGIYVDIVKGDPIIFCRLDNGTSDICGGFVLSKMESDITISPDVTSFKVERRKSPRFPVSILGYTNHVNDKKCSFPVWIKDISYDGLRIYTEADFNVKDRIGVNICISGKVLDIDGTIVRSSVLFGRNEYGIQITYRYKSSVFSIRESIDYLVEQERRLIEDHLMTQQK